ncbi:MAG TPA: 50S ribosomal protein L10 [Candidatus Eisenbacteria bacterium]|nr:50S ribosomal protein L10 [Candidatus Eisenbacteria bacterium]
MKTEDKVRAVEELKESFATAKGVYFADFQGMDVATATKLRNKCRDAGVSFTVVKNTLARRAMDPEMAKALDSVLRGPTAIAVSAQDQIVPAKILSDFMKEFERPALKAGIVDGKVVGKAQVDVLAKLPGREVLLARFAGGLKAPVGKLHTALSSPLQKLAMALRQVSEKKA